MVEEEEHVTRYFKKHLPPTLKHSLSFYRLESFTKPAKKFNLEDLVKEKTGTNRTKGFVSYSIFNANLTESASKINHIYIMGILQNAALVREVLPGWKILVFVDCASYTTYPDFYKTYLDLVFSHFGSTSVILLADFRTKLPEKYAKPFEPFKNVAKNDRGWDLALVARELGCRGNLPHQYPKTIWRFLPASYPVAFASRDADARLSAREAVAIDAWMHTTHTIHRCFDNAGHTNPFLAGMWGAKPMCHSIVGDFARYGTCSTSPSSDTQVAIPGILHMMLNFLSDRTLLFKSYGVDELMMGKIDDAAEKVNYTTVATYGQGAYYAGASGVSSLLEGRARLKLGMPLMTLLPATTPDTLQGSHQSLKEFKRGRQKTSLYAHDCYFIGEDLVLSSSADPGIAPWVRDLTLKYKDTSPSDLDLGHVVKAFKLYGVKLSAPRFVRDLTSLSLYDFKEIYHFDKRIFPQFWYTLLLGVPGEVSFFESNGGYATDAYELSVFERAMRTSFLFHRKMWPSLLTDIGLDNYDDKIEDLAEWMVSNRSRSTPFRFKQTNFASFYRMVKHEVMEHSNILKKLNYDDRCAYWQTFFTIYPFTSLRQWSFDF